MRISFILASGGLAGGIKSNRLIAEALARRGHSVTLYYSTAGPPRPSVFRPRTLLRWVLSEAKRRRNNTNSPGHLVSKLIPICGVDARPIRSSDVQDADVVVATWWETAEWIADWPSTKGKKCYFIRHYEVWGGNPDRVRQTYRLPLQKLVIANWLKRLMLEEFSDPNAVLVPNGVDRQQFFAPIREKNETPTVGFMYGKAKWKGADLAFGAIRRVQEALPKLKVVAFGPEPLEDDGHGIRNFEYVLRPDQSKISGIYSRTDCWLVPSTTEGFGMPGIEAAACRCPLVSTRCGGPEDYVEDGVNGYLTPVDDVTRMAEAIKKVVSQSRESWALMSEASFRISQRFDWDISAGLLEKAMLSLQRDSDAD